VSQVMRAATEFLDAKLTASEALERVAGSSQRAWPVSGESGVIGMVSLKQLRGMAHDEAESSMKQLGDLVAIEAFPHLHADHSLDAALERMGASKLEALPVVSRANVHQLEGVVTLEDVLALYGVGQRTE